MQMLSTLSRQFPFLLFMRFAALELARKLMDKYRNTSYAEFGEDRILKYYLNYKPSNEVYYVDIGCNQPINRSNTMAFYQRGAKGLAIDGNPACIAAYARVRPQDAVVTACVSDEAGIGLFDISDDDAVSKIVEEASESRGAECRKVSFRRAAELFEEHGVPKSFDILSVDVEGHELSAIKSCDLHRYRPRIIVAEIKSDEGVCGILESELVSYLKGQSYRLAGYVTRNAYFIDDSSM